jgi:hypothetical protein
LQCQGLVLMVLKFLERIEAVLYNLDMCLKK